eukprot:6343675-Heterocapsa_arctica.AAC.1
MDDATQATQRKSGTAIAPSDATQATQRKSGTAIASSAAQTRPRSTEYDKDDQADEKKIKGQRPTDT